MDHPTIPSHLWKEFLLKSESSVRSCNLLLVTTKLVCDSIEYFVQQLRYLSELNLAYKGRYGKDREEIRKLIGKSQANLKELNEFLKQLSQSSINKELFPMVSHIKKRVNLIKARFINELKSYSFIIAKLECQQLIDHPTFPKRAWKSIGPSLLENRSLSLSDLSTLD